MVVSHSYLEEFDKNLEYLEAEEEATNQLVPQVEEEVVVILKLDSLSLEEEEEQYYQKKEEGVEVE